MIRGESTTSAHPAVLICRRFSFRACTNSDVRHGDSNQVPGRAAVSNETQLPPRRHTGGGQHIHDAARPAELLSAPGDLLARALAARRRGHLREAPAGHRRGIVRAQCKRVRMAPWTASDAPRDDAHAHAIVQRFTMRFPAPYDPLSLDRGMKENPVLETPMNLPAILEPRKRGSLPHGY